jgi:hypothetical protein
MLVFVHFGTLSFDGIFERAGDVLTTGSATAIGLLFLIGAAGKSAQIPLYVWLPDAMEGPTPVSALIHAATMVTAGVYVVARSAAIFQEAPAAGMAVATVGALTALWAASIALAQTDIKKVLAYSTVSQLGFMFLAVGLGGYVAGVFHLMTHAFFKALLFLGRGSVIHGMADEQDMRKMGGLRAHMPVTAATMGVATLAISGFPLLAGFWSKDEILAVAFAAGGFASVLYVIGLVTALLTAFYMTRLWVMVFVGEPRWDEGVHPHESPACDDRPAGGARRAQRGGRSRQHAVPTRVGALPGAGFRGHLDGAPAGRHRHVPSAGGRLGGGRPGRHRHGRLRLQPTARGVDPVPDGFGRLWEAWSTAYRVDDLYGAALVVPGRKLAETAAFRFDLPIVDGLVNGVGRLLHGDRDARAGHTDRIRPQLRGGVRRRAAPGRDLAAGGREAPDARLADRRSRSRRRGRGSPPQEPQGAVSSRSDSCSPSCRSPSPAYTFFEFRGGRGLVPVHPAGGVVRAVGHRVEHRHRRDLAGDGRADHDPLPDLARRQHRHRSEGQGVRRPRPAAGGRPHRDVPGARPVPVLRVLRGDPRPDVLHHRHLGLGATHLRRHQVLPVHGASDRR